MQTQESKISRHVVKSLAVALVLLAPALTDATQPQIGKTAAAQPAGKKCQHRPLSDLLDAQGKGSVYFPPVKDYVGWTDGSFTIFALVDYAGLANAYLKDQYQQLPKSLGTRVNGTVVECKRADGKADVLVSLSAQKALGFAQSIKALADSQFDFNATPTIFGAKAQDVANGAEAAVGPASLLLSFVNGAPGAALPDLVDVINDNPATYAPVKLNFASTTVGKCADGTRALLHVHEVAATNDVGELVYSKETVDAAAVQGGSCLPDSNSPQSRK